MCILDFITNRCRQGKKPEDFIGLLKMTFTVFNGFQKKRNNLKCIFYLYPSFFYSILNADTKGKCGN